MAVADLLIFVLIAVGVVALAVVLFGTWVLMKVLGLVGRGIASLIGVPPAHRPVLAAPPTLRCPRPRCHAANAPAAKFCGRCGSPMDGQRVSAGPPRSGYGHRARGGRAAMW